MLTELQKARIYYDAYSNQPIPNRNSEIWNEMYGCLVRHFDFNYRQVSYVCDLLSQANQRKKYGEIYSKSNDYRFHTLRGLDQFHF